MQQNNLLEEAKSHFDHWRLTRPKRGKIIDYLSGLAKHAR